MGLPAEKERFTYADYLNWPKDERWELIHGIAYNMSPAPSVNHQRILRELALFWGNYLRDKPCELFISPFDVRLGSEQQDNKDIETVVQPDLAIVCDKTKLDEKGCFGPPELVIEIVSPHSAGKDKKEKFYLYEEYGIKEYWIVHPEEFIIEIFSLGDRGEYTKPQIFTTEDSITQKKFPGLEIPVSVVFGS